MKTKLLFSLLIFAVSAVGQDKAAESLEAGGLKFTVEAPWKKVQPASSMRAGQLKYGDKDIDAVFFVFGPQSVEANLARWKGQFSGEPESKTEEKKFGDTKVTYFTAKGTYMDGPPFGGEKTPKPDSTMLAAIIPSDGKMIFIKLVGKTADVDALKKDFDKLVASPFSK
ncbi:MAG: hypothetical protein HKN23_06395 [Verrucomicrobiales bacterium]|nr:hypothetical protein [Verrucomicrobiales bacterium]